MTPKPDRAASATFSALEQLQARQIAALEAENEELRGRLKLACEPCPECGSEVSICQHLRAIPDRGGAMNLAERAITSARAAEFTAEVREKVSAEKVSAAMESAVEALDALTSLCLAAVPPKLREELSAEKNEMWGDDGRGGSRDL